MKVSMKHMLTGEINTLDLDITQSQLIRYHNGQELIQNIFPNLSSEEREFLITGLLPGEYDEMFKDEEE